MNGGKYATEMPAMNYLTDEQIADVLNCTQQFWKTR